MEKIYIASDHAGYDAKVKIKQILENLGYEPKDLGPFNNKVPVDYPIYAKKVADKVNKGNTKGILICGSGTGMQIAANKIDGIRAAFAYDKYSAQMARSDNNANILTLRGREFDHSLYKEIIETFLQTEFSNLERHKQRVKEIKDLE